MICNIEDEREPEIFLEEVVFLPNCKLQVYIAYSERVSVLTKGVCYSLNLESPSKPCMLKPWSPEGATGKWGSFEYWGLWETFRSWEGALEGYWGHWSFPFSYFSSP